LTVGTHIETGWFPGNYETSKAT